LHPVEEKARLDLVRVGLKKFAQAIPLTLREVFGLDANPAYRGMERKVLAELVEMGVLSKTESAVVGQPVRFTLKNAKELERIVMDDVALAGVIWPSTRVPDLPPGQGTLALPTPPTEPPPFIAPEVVEDSIDNLSVEEKMDTMIGLFMNAMESMIYMREKIDKMEAKVNKLYAELTGDKA
jgi:hypothetical protein